jgi:hypothetical protein
MLPPASVSAPTPFGDFVQSEFCTTNYAICRIPASAPPPGHRSPNPFLPCALPFTVPIDTPSAVHPTAIFDPDFPAPEPSHNLTHHSFALPFSDSVSRNFARYATTPELLALYSAPAALVHHLGAAHATAPALNQWLRTCLPFATAAAVVDSTVNILFHFLDRRDTNRHSTASVLIQHATRAATATDWTTAYADDSETNFDRNWSNLGHLLP